FSGSTGAANNYHEIRDLTVGGAQTSTTTLTSSHNPSVVGAAVTFTCTVSGSLGTPTGTVEIFDGATSLGTRTLNASGQATLTTSALTLGSHLMRCEYSGDATYGVSTGTMTQVVNQPAPAPPAPAEVPEASTLLLMGGGLGGAGIWLRYQWSRLKRRKQ
ncbi:MAG: Ig-like domain-containing protein, partial [Anaerolineae bacterium]|nr:Ig-like domain-containing protein [Anaerolineae bacterium]